MAANQLSIISAMLITISLIITRRERQHSETASRNAWLDRYDYIVVGAGSAGSVVAARLSEDAGVKVLLLEAGGEQPVTTDIPNLYDTNRENSALFWSYESTPQRFLAQSLVNKTVGLQSGRVLGGSSSINGMIYNRGNRRVFDEWADRYGAKGWTYEEVLPYFLRAESNTDPRIVAQNSLYHGVGGPLPVSTPVDPDPVILAFRRAANLNGLRTVDFNGETQLGTMIVQKTISRNGVRASTSVSYLEPNRHRNNLHIICGALVTKILYRNSDAERRASGVSFARDGQNYEVYASREVVISAGSIKSAQLLMLSGIGPSDHLRDFSIPVVADLPVGNNLQDHPLVILEYIVRHQSYIRNRVDLSVPSLYNYYAHGSGPLSFFREVCAYFNSNRNSNKQFPDIYVSASVNQLASNLTDLVSQYAENMDEWRDYYRPYLGTDLYLEVLVALVKPTSVGTVRLASSDSYAQPIIDPNFLADPRETDALVDGLRQTIRLTENRDFSKYARLFARPVPGCATCSTGPLSSCEPYLRCLVRNIGTTDSHLVGTCRMGSANDSDAVVDERLRVRGVSGLRVIDASVMPNVVNSNINAAVIMIGEHGSQMIKDDSR